MNKPNLAACSAIGRLTLSRSLWILTAAGGLCAAAGLAFVQIRGSETTPAAKPSGAALHRVEGNSATSPSRLGHGTADPARELAEADALHDQSDREGRIRSLLTDWAARDAEAALDWVSGLENPAARRSARSTICLAVAETDPRQAVTLALAHGADEDDHGALLEHLTMHWCGQEPEAALSWACGQPPGEWRDRLLASASFVLSKSDPAAAAHLVSDLEPGTVQDEAVMAVLHQWALQDSAAALEWAEAFPESALRHRAVAEITNLRSHHQSP